MKNFAKKALVVLFVVVIAGMMFTGCSKKTSDTIKIGGIFPLSGVQLTSRTTAKTWLCSRTESQ